MNTTTYTQEDLRKMSLDMFKTISATYLRGCCVGGKWSLRVTNDRVLLVQPYTVKDLDGTWYDKEKTIVL